MPQLQINQGPQDALLYDNNKSYFTNVGYVRTSNFQVEYRDVDSQNNANFGQTVQFIIPKAADLLGPVDLRLELESPISGSATGAWDPTTTAGQLFYSQWVDELGFAMIDKMTFSVGSNDIETITGEQMQIQNELMTSDEMRLGYDHIMKTGRRAFLGGHDVVVKCTIGSHTGTATSPSAGTAVSTSNTTIPSLAGMAIPGGTAGTRAIEVGDVVYKADGTFIGKVRTAIAAQTGATHTTGLAVDGVAVHIANGDDLVVVGMVSHYYPSEVPLPAKTGNTNTTGTTTGTTTYGKLMWARRNGFQEDYTRLCAYKAKDDPVVPNTAVVQANRRLNVPLSFFFAKHVSQYFPLAAVAGCNDVRVSIKFRPLKELLQVNRIGSSSAPFPSFPSNNPIKDLKLRCHYVHVTGPEAQLLMNKEHVRLLKLWQHQSKSFTDCSSKNRFDLDLSLLHPCSTLIVTIRREEDVANSSVDNHDAAQKGFFFYHGDGTNPNYDRSQNQLGGQSCIFTDAGSDADATSRNTVKVQSIELSLNGQERHPGLPKGIESEFIRSRLIPGLHSNSNTYQKQMTAMSVHGNPVASGFPFVSAQPESESMAKYGLQGSKNIFVYPFSLNPEGGNPAGAVNFSKVSHAKLSIHLDQPEGVMGTSNVADINNSLGGTNYRVDVYALYYNWLQIKDGRALLSFA